MFFRKCLAIAAILIPVIFQLADPAIGSKPLPAKLAFMRNGQLWIAVNGKEIQVSKSRKTMNPAWSVDGKYLAYVVQNEGDRHPQSIHIYDVGANKTVKIYKSGVFPKWSPRPSGGILAYKEGTVLNVSDFRQFRNAALGVDTYVWNPDGSGFVLSNSGKLTPTGWTGATLYKKVLPRNWMEASYSKKVEKFFSLPNVLSHNGTEIIAPFVSHFSFSPSGRWLSFVVSPTASWSMDSNMICVISADGGHFEVLDEVILQVGRPKWAPSKDILAFIGGGGRLVTGFKDKDLKTKDYTAFKTYTPENYADLDFAWEDDRTILVSRMKEADWSNDLSKHPQSTLFVIDTVSGKQTQVTSPPEKEADSSPDYIRSVDKMIWVRWNYRNKDANIWMADPDGSDAKLWLKNADSPVIYQGKES